MPQQQPTAESLVRTAQIITLGMAGGVVAFVLIAVVAVGALSESPSGNIVSLVGIVLTASQLGLAVFVPNLVARRAGPQQSHVPAELQPYSMFMVRHLIRLALLEGAAFFNVVATMIEHNWWSLGIAGVLVGWMLTNFPTRVRIDRWIAAQGIGNSE